MLRKGDLTQGGITTTLLQFTLPMLAGSLLQQCYNIPADRHGNHLAECCRVPMARSDFTMVTSSL